MSLGFWEWGCSKRGDTHITVTPHSRNCKGNEYKLLAQRFLGLFGRSSVTYDWLVVVLDTIDQS